MKTREKLLITLSVLACGISIAVFALVSLGHFIYQPDRTTLPVVGKMYEGTVQQVALLETVPVPQAPQPVTNTPTPPPAELPNSADSHAASDDITTHGKNYKNQKNRDAQAYADFKKTLAALFGLL